MVVISYAGKEANAKIVYYGPGLGGKTTNLEFIYDSVPSSSRGKMVSMKTQTDRTLFFDFLPLDLGELGGFKTRFLLYTVPGQVFYNATRKLVLRGVDAVAFIADSQVGKMDENKESLANLEENLAEYDLSLDSVPWVIQYNKRDVPEVYTLEELNNELNPRNVPYFEAIATEGVGVFETFRGLSKLLLEKLSQQIGHRLIMTKHIGPEGEADGMGRADRIEETLLAGEIDEEILTAEEAVDTEEYVAAGPESPGEAPQTIELEGSGHAAEETVSELGDDVLEELEVISEEVCEEPVAQEAPAPTLQAEQTQFTRESEMLPSFFDRAARPAELDLCRETLLLPEIDESAEEVEEPARAERQEEMPGRRAQEPVAAQFETEEYEPMAPHSQPGPAQEPPGHDVDVIEQVESPALEDTLVAAAGEAIAGRSEPVDAAGTEPVKSGPVDEEVEEDAFSFVNILRRNNVGVFHTEQAVTEQEAMSEPEEPEPVGLSEPKPQEQQPVETTLEVPVVLKPGETVTGATFTIRLKLKLVDQEKEATEHEFVLQGLPK